MDKGRKYPESMEEMRAGFAEKRRLKRARIYKLRMEREKERNNIESEKDKLLSKRKLKKEESIKKEAEILEHHINNIKKERLSPLSSSFLLLPPPIKYISGDKKLSILICSIKGRERELERLLDLLELQTTNDVEILVEVDNKKITIGEKRNILLKRARGDYVTFVDDDDKVSSDYIFKILGAIETSPDCCGIEGEIDHMQGRRRQRYRCTQKFIHSRKYTKWYEQNKIYYRCPNHLNPIRRELAGQIMFPEKSQGEDKIFSMLILSLLKTEVFIEGIIYYYKAI